MIIHDCIQGDARWHALHVGIPTSSSFKKIIQPARLKPSASQDTYRDHLIAEWILGRRIQTNEDDWMRRGKELEPDAAAFYEMEHGVDAKLVGFVTRDDGMVGCSPDRLLGDDGLLEIKCPKIETHIGYMRDQGLLLDEYRLQVAGQLWLTERAYCDLMSFSPREDVPPVVIRVERDEALIEKLAEHVNGFVERLLAVRAEHLARGVTPGPVSHQDAPGGYRDPRSLGKAAEEGWLRNTEGWVEEEARL